MSPLTTPAAIDRTDRGANPGLLVLLIVCLLGAIGLFYFLPGGQGAKLLFGIITVLAVLGIFSTLLYTFGILQFAGQAARNDTTKAIADTNSDGLIVTDSESRIIYANEAYHDAVGGARRLGRARGRAAVLRRAGSFGGDLSARAGGARGQTRRRGIADVAAAGRRGVGRLVPHPRASARDARPRPARRCGASPTSRASASATKTSFRSCSTRSTISITRRPASSRSSRTARSPI